MPSSEVDLVAAADPVAAFFDAARRGHRLALPTSGTSGTPRTIVRTTASWTDSFTAVSELTGIDATSRVHVPGPLSATMNLFAAVHARWAGASSAHDLSEATHAYLTPTALRRVLTTGADDLSGQHLVVAGDRVEPAVRGLVAGAGGRLSHFYGAAELSFVAWGEHADDLRPFPGVDVEVRDGELWVRSPYLGSGYLEPQHQLRTDSGWASVGDRGEVVDGRVLVHGREGGITTAGATVRIAEIEQTLRAGAAGEVVVVGLPHRDLGEVVAAAVTDPDDRDRLRAIARDSLTTAQRPRRWLHLDPLPRTTHDKVDRSAVVAAFAEVDR